METWTKENVRLWRKSPEFIEQKQAYQKEKEELREYIRRYAGKRMELEQQCQPHIRTHQYGLGDSNMQRGALCPSKIFDVVVGNVTRGRLVKNIGKKQPTYIYSFDEDGRLIKAETTKEYFEKSFLVEYILYEGDCEIGITYRVKENRKEELVYVTRVTRERGKLISYEWGYGIDEEKNRMWELYSEKYFYDEEGLVKVDRVTLMGENLQHYRVFVKINEQGQALSYTSNEIIGEKVFENDYVREIKKKVLFFDEPENDTTKPSDSNKTTPNPTEAKKELINTNHINCLYSRIKAIMETWNKDEEIYAISFFLQDGGEGEIPSLAVSYNTEEYCDSAPDNDEERWNYACWSQDEENVIEEQEEKILKEWYESQGISVEELGYEDSEENYDENGNDIGKGPKGLYELVQILPDVAKKLREEKVVERCCKKNVPIIIHDLEYTWYMVEATKKANPGVDLSGFLGVIGY